MEKNIDIAQSLSVIKNVADNPSWFGEHAHRWPVAALPIGYAMACVEIVSKKSERAGVIYRNIIEAWGKPGIDAAYKEIISKVPDSEKEEWKRMLKYPETVYEPDANKPFTDFEEMVKDPDFINALFKDEDDIDNISPEEQREFEELARLFLLMFEFILIGFNRESDVEKGKYRVVTTEKAPWLILAIIYRTGFEYRNITLDRLNRIYKLRKIGKKTYDFEKILTEEPMSRMHRRMVAYGKKANLKLKNDRIFMNAARHWYQCRVVYSSINKFCDVQSKKGILLDPKNVQKEIRHCDQAVGYHKRKSITIE
jgi:hypothetical protein